MKITCGLLEKICEKFLDRVPDLAEPLCLAAFEALGGQPCKTCGGVRRLPPDDNLETKLRLVSSPCENNFRKPDCRRASRPRCDERYARPRCTAHREGLRDRKSTRLNSSHLGISY